MIINVNLSIYVFKGFRSADLRGCMVFLHV